MFERYLDEVPDADVICRSMLGQEPHAKQRARMAHGHVHNTEANERYERYIKIAMGVMEKQPAGVACGVRAIFHIKGRQRKDVDNMLKTVMDGLNRVAFEDDTQVVESMAWKVIDSDNPRTELVVYRIPGLAPLPKAKAKKVRKTPKRLKPTVAKRLGTK